MAHLGTVVIKQGTLIGPITTFSATPGVSLGSAVIRTSAGYVYQPPTVGQLWPRGDYSSEW